MPLLNSSRLIRWSLFESKTSGRRLAATLTYSMQHVFFSRHGTAWVHVKIESIEGASETMVYHHDLLSDTPLYQWHSIMVSWYHGCLWNNGFSTSHGFLLSTRHGVSSLVDISCPTGDLTPRHMRPSTQDGATTVLEKPGMPDARPKSEGSFF